MTLSAKVYDGTAPGTLIVNLASAFKRGWFDQLNDVGSGTISLHVSDADLGTYPSLKNYYNIVRLGINGTDRFAFIIEQRACPPAPPGEDAERIWTLSGRGVLAVLESAIVYTEAPITGSYARQRFFDWTAIAYDDSAWSTAVYVDQIYPTGWPAASGAVHIWSRAVDGSNRHPPGTSLFRSAFTMGADSDVAILASADDGMRVWLDGQQIISAGTSDADAYLGADSQTSSFLEISRYDVFLPAGTHQLAIEGTNLSFNHTSQGRGPGSILLSVMQVNEDHTFGTEYDFTYDDGSWVCLDYPSLPLPGMPIGQILRILIEEAQARGCFPDLTIGFADTTDSNSAAYTVTDPNLAIDIGTNLLDVIRMFVEQFVDVHMSPTLQLDIYNKGTLGSDLTGTVSLLVGQDFEQLDNSAEAHLTNSMLTRATTGQLSVHEDATSLASRPRREDYSELATAPDSTRAGEVAAAVFTDFANPAAQTSGRVIESSGPYTTWAPGDVIMLPTAAGGTADTKVMSLGVTEDEETGRLVYAITGAQDDD